MMKRTLFPMMAALAVAAALVGGGTALILAPPPSAKDCDYFYQVGGAVFDAGISSKAGLVPGTPNYDHRICWFMGWSDAMQRRVLAKSDSFLDKGFGQP